jgi:pyruvate/2-oxoglutarate dehydrogenase complex dihydrolipoamide acyltransferase (E2) component
VEEVAHTIRCASRRILSVEAGRFEELPQQPYARGLVATYATLVDLDAAALLRACGPSLGLDGGAPTHGIFPRPPSERFNWRDWTVPLTLAGALALFLLARTALTPEPAPLPGPAVVPAEQPLPPVQAPPATEAPANPEPAPAPAAAPGVRVLLRSEGSTWVDVAVDGVDAKRIEVGPGQNLELSARERLALSLGDAGVVRVRVDDRELGFIGFKGEMKTGIVFTAAKPQAGRPGAERRDSGARAPAED